MDIKKLSTVIKTLWVVVALVKESSQMIDMMSNKATMPIGFFKNLHEDISHQNKLTHKYEQER